MMSSTNIMYWNCANGIFSKKDLIKEHLKTHKPELFFISEAEINKNKETNLLECENYELSLSNTLSDTRKARICCYSTNDWTKIPNSSISDEILAYQKSNQIVICLYRPFKYYIGETTTTNFERLLANVQNIVQSYQNHALTIIGDFNIDYKKIGDQTYQRHNLANLLQDFQIFNNLNQLVNDITRHRMIEKNGERILQTSILDHVYVNGLHVDNIEVLPTIASDHNLIKVNMINKKEPIGHTKLYLRDWRKHSKETFTFKILYSLNLHKNCS